ncbi:MAG: macro domain-containing protein [bacterium]
MKIKKSTLKIIQGDIAEFEADAVFCPDTYAISMSSGLSQVIRAKEGEEIFESTREHIPVEKGGIIYSAVKKLKVSYVIWGAVIDPDSEINRDEVQKAINSAMELCVTLSLKSIAFPMITSPLAFIPYDTFARLILESIFDFLLAHEEYSLNVNFVLFNEEAYNKVKSHLDIIRQEYFI